MTSDDKLTEAIQLIKAGQIHAARIVLEPFLLDNPYNIQAWFWETELFTDPAEKVKVLEICLRRNPDNPQALQALTFFKNKAELNQPLQAPTPAPAYYPPPPSLYPEPGPASYRAVAPVKPAAPVSPFSVSPDWSDDSENPVTALRPATTESAFLESPRPAESPQGPQPTSPKKAASPKKPIRLSPQMLKALLVVLGSMAFLAILGLYVGGGYYLSGQIRQSFAGQNCAEVVQQAAFASYYPEGIFGSMLTGYAQLGECRIKLGVEQAVAAKNWEGAISLAQQYLATYPNGPFAKNLSEQAPEFLSTWSGELIASHGYGTGIEKLEQLLETYPDSPPAATAPEIILQTYLVWARELTDKQNYKEAEYPLKSALTYFEADPPRSEQIKRELASLYLAWGDLQVQQGDLDNSIKTYQKAGEIFPGQIDIAFLTARAYLQKALAISKTNNFDKALAKVKEVSDAAQAENVLAEANAAREEILNAYAASTAPQATDQLTAAITLTCQGEARPELPIFGRDPETIRFGLIHPFATLPTDWAAETPGELHYVICSTETEAEIETCRYTQGHYLVRMRYIWKVILYDLLNGEAAATKNIRGADPDVCPSKANFSVVSATSRSYGPRPTVEDLVAWLVQLKLTK